MSSKPQAQEAVGGVGGVGGGGGGGSSTPRLPPVKTSSKSQGQGVPASFATSSVATPLKAQNNSRGNSQGTSARYSPRTSMHTPRTSRGSRTHRGNARGNHHHHINLDRTFANILSNGNILQEHLVDTTHLEIDRPGRQSVKLNPAMGREELANALLKMLSQYASVAFRDSITHWNAEVGTGTLRQHLAEPVFIAMALKLIAKAKHSGPMATELAKLLLYYQYEPQPNGPGTLNIVRFVSMATPRVAAVGQSARMKKHVPEDEEDDEDATAVTSPRTARSGALTERGAKGRAGTKAERRNKPTLTPRGFDRRPTKKLTSVGLEAVIEDAVTVNTDTCIEEFLPRLLKTLIYRLHMHITGRTVLADSILANVIVTTTELWRNMNIVAFTYRSNKRNGGDDDEAGGDDLLGLPPQTPGTLASVLGDSEDEAIVCLDMIDKMLRDIHHLPDLVIFGNGEVSELRKRKSDIDKMMFDRRAREEDGDKESDNNINGMVLVDHNVSDDAHERKQSRYQVACRAVELAAMITNRLAKIFPDITKKSTYSSVCTHVRGLMRLINLGNGHVAKAMTVPSFHGRPDAFLPKVDVTECGTKTVGHEVKHKLSKARHGPRKKRLAKEAPKFEEKKVVDSDSDSGSEIRGYSFSNPDTLKANMEAHEKLQAAGIMKHAAASLEEIDKRDKLRRTHFDVRRLDINQCLNRTMRLGSHYENMFERHMKVLDRISLDEYYRRSYKRHVAS